MSLVLFVFVLVYRVKKMRLAVYISERAIKHACKLARVPVFEFCNVSIITNYDLNIYLQGNVTD